MVKKISGKEIIEKGKNSAKKIKDKTKSEAKEFKREFRKEMRTAMLAAFGFLIALTWRDAITEFVKRVSEKSPFKGALVTAIGVTAICVIGIMVITKMFKEKEEGKNEGKK